MYRNININLDNIRYVKKKSNFVVKFLSDDFALNN